MRALTAQVLYRNVISEDLIVQYPPSRVELCAALVASYITYNVTPQATLPSRMGWHQRFFNAFLGSDILDYS